MPESSIFYTFEPDLYQKLMEDPTLTAEMYSFIERLTQESDFGNVSDDEKSRNEQEIAEFADHANLIGRFLTSDFGELELSIYGGVAVAGKFVDDNTSGDAQ